jgi:hypothetical protein
MGDGSIRQTGLVGDKHQTVGEGMEASISSTTIPQYSSSFSPSFSPSLSCPEIIDARLNSPTNMGLSPPDLLALRRYDLVLSIRFLNRAFLPTLLGVVRSGGYVVISTFVNDGIHTYDKPRGSRHRLELGEIRRFFERVSESERRSGRDYLGEWEVLEDRIEQIDDGRPVNSVLAQRKVSMQE